LQALNDRLAATPGCEQVIALATDPGLTSTGALSFSWLCFVWFASFLLGSKSNQESVSF
jgi:hypothetical protein